MMFVCQRALEGFEEMVDGEKRKRVKGSGTVSEGSVPSFSIVKLSPFVEVVDLFIKVKFGSNMIMGLIGGVLFSRMIRALYNKYLKLFL